MDIFFRSSSRAERMLGEKGRAAYSGKLGMKVWSGGWKAWDWGVEESVSEAASALGVEKGGLGVFGDLESPDLTGECSL